METATSVNMKDDIEVAVRFLCGIVKHNKKLTREQVERFGEFLISVLCERFTGHWYPDEPLKGQAYRCIRINQRNPVDDSFLAACKAAGFEYAELHLPPQFTMWIDPGDVSCRLSESSQPFCIGDEYRSGKSSPDQETSDYHSRSPSECSSEDEPRARSQEEMRAKIEENRLWMSSTTRAPGLWVPSPLWVPYECNMLTYVQPHQPAVLYFINTQWKPPVTRRSDPNLTKRLTKRGSRM